MQHMQTTQENGSNALSNTTRAFFKQWSHMWYAQVQQVEDRTIIKVVAKKKTLFPKNHHQLPSWESDNRIGKFTKDQYCS